MRINKEKTPDDIISKKKGDGWDVYETDANIEHV